ncbi:ChaN family lipoprotein [Desulforhopalus sp. 52FAK]
MSYLFNTCFISCLSILILFTHHGTAYATDKDSPLYELAISFDIEHNRLTGTAKIIIPAHNDLSLSLAGLTITGAFVQHANGAENILDDRSNVLGFTAEPSARTLYLSYIRDVSNDYSSLIDKQGISLTHGWYPYPSGPYIFKLSAQLPEGFTAITQSDSFPLSAQSGTVQSTWSKPATDISFIAGPYETQKIKVRDDLFVYSMFFHEDKDLTQGYLEAAADYIRKYEKEVGSFPYNHYVIVANRLPTGYGMPSFTLIGQMVLRLPFIKSSSLGHEILHSWFGNDVEVDYEYGNWCEGLTSFLADHAYRAAEGKGPEDRKASLIKYHSYVHGSNTEPFTLTDFRSASHNQPLADAKRSVGYNGGAFLFHELQELLGKEVFSRGIRNFYTSNSGQSASWRDIQTSFETVSGKNLQTFFKTRLTMKTPPQITATDISIQSKSGITLSFTLGQTADAVVPLQIPIHVTTMSGTYVFHEQLDVASKNLTLRLPDMPLRFSLDPDYTLLRQLAPEEVVPVWSQFLGAEKKLIILASEADRQKYSPFIHSLKKYDPTVAVADSVTNQMLIDNNLLFLGANQLPCRSIFGSISHKEGSLTVDIRKNPLHPGFVAAIISDKRKSPSPSAARRLSHYGRYSYLEFNSDGSVEKDIATAANGIKYQLERLPAGGATGALSGFDTIIDELLTKRVIYLGETHNSLPDHILQLRVIEALYQKDPQIAIAMEMFPSSSQKSLDAFTRTGSTMDEKTFLKESDYFNVWRYDYRLFRNTLNFAKEKNIPVLGINLDRKIVSDVFRAGNTDGLSQDVTAHLVIDRNLDLPGYQERLAVVHNAHVSGKHASGGSSGFIQSQALWDETMAVNIVSYLNNNPERRVIVIAGNQHTRKDSGIPPRVSSRIDTAQASVINIYDGTTPANILETADYFFLADNLELPPSPKIGLVLTEPAEGSTMKGLTIDQLSPHGKAGDAGLKVGDIVIRLGDDTIEDMADLRIAMIDASAGDTLEIEVLRGDKEKQRQVFKVELTIPQMPKGHP